MKLDTIVQFARAHNIRAVTKGRDGSHALYYFIVDTLTATILEDVGRYERENNLAIRLVPFREYRDQGTEIWRETKQHSA